MVIHYRVTGGAGYIGSHLTRALIQNGDTATILDNFSTVHRWATQGQAVIDVDLRDLEALSYYQNNVGGTANLLKASLRPGSSALTGTQTETMDLHYGSTAGKCTLNSAP